MGGKENIELELHTVSGGELAGSAIVSFVCVVDEEQKRREKQRLDL